MTRFITKILLYYLPFIFIYGFYEFNVKKNISGDLGVLGQIQFGKQYNENLEQNYLLNNFVQDTFVFSNENIFLSKDKNIVTIGDSYSRQGIFGYQNYLAHILGNSIINVIILPGFNQFETAVSLLNSNIIDESNCQFIILQFVDRQAIFWLKNLNFELLYQFPETIEKQIDNSNNSDLFRFVSWIRLQFGYDRPYRKFNLKYDCFSHNYYSRTCFTYIDDLDFIKTKHEDILKAKENLTILSKKFSDKGIKIIFLIGADKYDVYRPFMTNDSLPVDTTTDVLSDLPDVCIINTKPLLQEMVRNGDKDVFMVNDSHWSYKASEAVANQIAHEIEFLK